MIGMVYNWLYYIDCGDFLTLETPTNLEGLEGAKKSDTDHLKCTNGL